MTETFFELEKADADRSRLADRITDLQKELETTRSFITTVIQHVATHKDVSPNVTQHPLQNSMIPGTQRSTKNGTSNCTKCTHKTHNGDCSSDSLEDWFESEHDNEFSCPSRLKPADSIYSSRHSNCRHRSCRSCTNHSYSASVSSQRERRRRSRRARARQDTIRPDVGEELARLTSRTAALEAVAVNLKNEFDRVSS